MMLCTPFQFQSPCSIMVVEPSSCGKTVFVKKLMRERSRLFTPPYNPVVYCYGANQPTTFDRMKKFPFPRRNSRYPIIGKMV